MDGAVLVDKPVGRTSNAVLQEIKRLFAARKAGHAGTLDPLASGLLVVLFGEATKFAAFLLDEDKEYVATVKLGERTSTGDAEGAMLETKAVPEALAQTLPAVLEQFRGEIEQVPPMHSALKRGGVPLYVLARRGEALERKPRKVRIHEIEVLRIEKPTVELRVRCSKGTYVRTLAEDIGVALGTVAHLAALRRTASGRFAVGQAATPERLASLPAQERIGRLLGLEALLEALPRADLDTDAAARFRNGQTVGHAASGPVCGVYGPDGKVIGLGEGSDGRLRPLRLTASASG
ncbi:MAG: tRNA pseudouridine(55) synthase TruB [Clostridia bacterium]